MVSTESPSLRRSDVLPALKLCPEYKVSSKPNFLIVFFRHILKCLGVTGLLSWKIKNGSFTVVWGMRWLTYCCSSINGQGSSLVLEISLRFVDAGDFAFLLEILISYGLFPFPWVLEVCKRWSIFLLLEPICTFLARTGCVPVVSSLTLNRPK